MRIIFCLFIVACVLHPAGFSVWASPQISGYLSNYTVYRVVDNDSLNTKGDNDILKFENKIKLEVKHDADFGPFSTSFFISGNAAYDPSAEVANSDFVYSDGDFSCRLRDAYVDINHENYDIDVRIGKQVVVWGNSDGMPVTDIVTPLNLNEFVIPDYEDLRIAIPMIKANYYYGDYTFEGIFIPKFYPNELAFEGPWTLMPDFGEFERKSDFSFGGTRVHEIIPDESDDYEFGLKVSGFLFDTDFSVMFFQTYEDTPTALMPPSLQADLDPQTPLIQAGTTYNHVNMYGFTMSRPLSSFVLRSEAAFYKGKMFPAMNAVDVYSMTDVAELVSAFDNAGKMYEKDFLHYMIGSDYSGFKGLVVSGQFEQKIIFNFDKDDLLRNLVAVQKLVSDFDKNDSMEEMIKLGAKMSGKDSLLEEFENSITLMLQRGNELEDTFFTQVVFMKNLTFKDYMVKITAGYSFREGFWLYFGYNMLAGESDTAFGIFDENDNVFVRLKYSF